MTTTREMLDWNTLPNQDKMDQYNLDVNNIWDATPPNESATVDYENFIQTD